MRVTTRLVLVLGLAVALMGCSLMPSSDFNLSAEMGIRPSLPALESKVNCSQRYADFQRFGRLTETAYRSRATQNRNWVYVAGTLLLGTTAATGGLAAAGATVLTLALLGISGAFGTGVFAMLDNGNLAVVYTAAADDIAKTRMEADAEFFLGVDYRDARKVYMDYLAAQDAAVTDTDEPPPDPPATQLPNSSTCEAAVHTLWAGLNRATETLEEARTSAAVAALLRAKEEQKKLQAVIDKTKKADIEAAVKNGTIKPERISADRVRLVLTGADLSGVAIGDLQVRVGVKEVGIEGFDKVAGGYHLDFTVPPAATGEVPEARLVRLLIKNTDVSFGPVQLPPVAT